MLPKPDLGYFTTDGLRRGCCGHKHTTRKAAERCLTWDNFYAGKAGETGDRAVVFVPPAPMEPTG